MKFREPKKVNVIANNTIIAYINGKAIVKNEWGNIFYSIIPKEYVTIGEVLASEDITPIDELDEQERNAILDVLNYQEEVK